MAAIWSGPQCVRWASHTWKLPWYWNWSLIPGQLNPSRDSWWLHQMETFYVLLALCAGNSPVTDEFPHKDQWRGVLVFSLIRASINGWVNNRGAGDKRWHRAHYDVTVMSLLTSTISKVDGEGKWNIHELSGTEISKRFPLQNFTRIRQLGWIPNLTRFW